MCPTDGPQVGELMARLSEAPAEATLVRPADMRTSDGTEGNPMCKNASAATAWLEMHATEPSESGTAACAARAHAPCAWVDSLRAQVLFGVKTSAQERRQAAIERVFGDRALRAAIVGFVRERGTSQTKDLTTCTSVA